MLKLESTGLDEINRWVTAQQVCCLAWSRFVNFFIFVWSQKNLQLEVCASAVQLTICHHLSILLVEDSCFV